MSEKILEFTGYHGTSHIQKTNFKISKSGWLGEGVYFFEDNEILARNWARKKFGNCRIDVIKKTIMVNQDNLFDLSNPNSDDSKYYHEQRCKFIHNHTKHQLKAKYDTKKRYENIILNEICKNMDIHCVRACTYTYQIYDDEYETDSIFPNGIELCVKNLEYIV